MRSTQQVVAKCCSKTKYFYIKTAKLRPACFPKKERKILSKLKRDEFQVFQVLTPRSLSINWMNFFRLVKNRQTGDAIRWGPERLWLWTNREISLVCLYQNNLFSPFHFSPFRIFFRGIFRFQCDALLKRDVFCTDFLFIFYFFVYLLTIGVRLSNFWVLMVRNWCAL